MKIGSLFTGYGGLDVAAETFFGAETAWTCDIDPGASKIIAHHWPDIPNLHDITQVDWDTVEPVDILVGGWPCQPFSLAGKQKGAADERALWPHVAETIRRIRPRHIVLENVAAITTAGELGRALSDLAALRYVGQWRCLRAADVGAPHGRARIFILATNTDLIGHQRSRDTRHRRGGSPNDSGTPADTGSSGWREENPRGRHMVRESGIQSGRDESPSPSRPHRHAAADTTSYGRDEGWPESTRLIGGSDAAQRSTGLIADTTGDTRRLSNRNNGFAADAEGAERRGTQPNHMGAPIEPAAEPRECASTTTDACCGRCRTAECDLCAGQPDIAWGAYEPAIRRWEHTLGRLAPPPTETSPKGSQRLSPAFVEWMMGLPAGWVIDVPDLTRNAQMKALGNGVVPQQALAALELMA